MSSLPPVRTMTQQVRETEESVSGAESQSRMSPDSRTKRTNQSSCRLLLWEEREKGKERKGEDCIVPILVLLVAHRWLVTFTARRKTFDHFPGRSTTVPGLILGRRIGACASLFLSAIVTEPLTLCHGPFWPTTMHCMTYENRNVTIHCGTIKRLTIFNTKISQSTTHTAALCIYIHKTKWNGWQW